MKKLVLIVVLVLATAVMAPAQNFEWARGMGRASTNDIGYAIVTSASGNVYTTGKFIGPVDFDPGPGTYNLPTGGIFIQKLNAAGNFVWAKEIGPSSVNVGYGITVDASESVYITGIFSGTADFDPGPGVYNLTTGSGGPGFVAKYDSSGNLVWAKAIIATDGDIRPIDIALDPSGNVFTAGFYSMTVDFDPGPGSYNLMTSSLGDGFLLKLDPMGNFLWARGVGTTDAEAAHSLVVDNSGNAVFTCSYWGSGTFLDILIYKYNAAGTQVWVKGIGGAGVDDSNDMAVDGAGNVYITGSFEGTADFNPNGTFNLTSAGGTDGFVVKLDAGGSMVWAGSVGGTGSDAGYRIDVDAAGNCHIGGYFQGTVDFDPGPGTFNMTSAGFNAPCIIKLDAVGGLVFALQFAGASGNAAIEGLNVGTNGEILTTGSFGGTPDMDPGPAVFTLTGTAMGADYFVQKLSICSAPPAPTNTTPANNLTICAGNSTTLTASGIANIAWYAGPSGGASLGTSGTFVTPVLGSTTTYYVQDSACLASPRTAITVTVHPATASSISPAVCYSYTSPSGQVWTSSGTYMDTLVNAAGCDSVITVNLTIHAASSSTLSPSTCDSFISPSGSYVWTASGIYMDTLTNTLGCDSIITVQLTVVQVDTSVTNASPLLTANAMGATYQWMYCDSAIIPGATNLSFTATANGNYAVMVTQNGCTDTSACIAVTNVVGMADETMGNWRIHPNPAQGVCWVSWEGFAFSALEVWNATGQLMATYRVGAENTIKLDVDGLVGVYIVRICWADGSWASQRILVIE